MKKKNGLSELFKGNVVGGLFLMTVRCIPKTLIFSVIICILVNFLVVIIDVEAVVVFFALTGLLIFLEWVFFSGYEKSRPKMPRKSIELYGNHKTIYFNLYVFIIRILTLVSGIICFLKLKDDTILDVEQINSMYVYFCILVFCLSLNPTVVNFKFWACPKCKRGLMMEEFDNYITDSYNRAEFESVDGRFVSSNPYNANATLGYEPGSQNFKGIYKYTKSKLILQCFNCVYEKEVNLLDKERIL